MKKRNTLLSLAAPALLIVGLSGCSKTPEPQPQASNEPTQTSPVPMAEPVAAVAGETAASLKEPPAPPRAPAWRPVKKADRSPAPAAQAQAPAAAPAPVASTPAPVSPAPAGTRQAVAEPPAKAAPPPPAPLKVKLDEGTVIAARVGETLNSERNSVGDSFSATLGEPLVINGFVIAERGARVEGKVVNVERAGKMKGTATLQLALTTLHTSDGQTIPIQTDAFLKKGPDTTKSDVGKVAIASGIGAAIGAIAGRGKGAGIGAGAGAAAGTGAVLATRGKPAEIPAETLLRFRISEPVTITEKIR